MFTDSYPARVTELADQPLARLAPADLATVTAALAGAQPPAASAGRSFLELLRDCLEAQFASGGEPASGSGRA